jgi:hypothetical protein
MVAGKQEGTVLLENARIIFRNFAGAEKTFNPAGRRNFSVVLDEDTAKQMEADGWNVKRRPPREDGDDELIHLQVTVSFKGRPPRLAMITSRGRTMLDADSCELLDYAEFDQVDLILRPYDWEVSGKTGRKAYLKSGYFNIREDELELKYADVPDAGQAPHRDYSEDDE